METNQIDIDPVRFADQSSDKSARSYLTPSQVKIYDDLAALLPRLSVIIIKGVVFSGKNFTVNAYFKDREITPISFDLCELATSLNHRISSQDVIKYLQLLQQRVMEIADKRRRVIYIRRFDRISDIVASYRSENGDLFHLAVRQWIYQLPKRVKLILTCEYSLRIDVPNYWVLELTLTRSDAEFLFRRQKIPEEKVTELLKFSNVQVPGQLLSCLKYAKSQPERLVERYQESYGKLTGTSLDVEKEVPKTEPVTDLIGLDSILEELYTSIIFPIELNHPSVTIKKGIVLYGRPGCGKSQIGRWLAHRLKGKLYLVGGEAGVSGTAFITSIENNLNLAAQNAPAVVFIDDVDTIFENNDSYRALLTLLDGLDNKRRNNVCVIVTCMNLQKIPSSLIRGGRLEMCLHVPLPNRETIKKILKLGMEKILSTLRDIYPDKVGEVEQQFTSSFYQNLSGRMLGQNCADIHRAIQDVLRLVLSKREFNLESLFNRCLESIRNQYEKCGKIDTAAEEYSSLYS